MAPPPQPPLTRHLLDPDPSKVVLRPLSLGPARLARILSEVEALSEADAAAELSALLSRFSHRHPSRLLEAALTRHAPTQMSSLTKTLLAGAHLTCEYSVEAAAVANPSLFRLRSGEWLLSLRSIGEGHISTITFRRVRVSATSLEVLPSTGSLHTGEVAHEPDDVRLLTFPHGTSPDEMAITSTSLRDSHGLEDARFVATPLGGEVRATATAYDGENIRIDRLRTKDFSRFTIEPLSGPGARDKGLALFPESDVSPHPLGVSRSDGENLWLTEETSPAHFDLRARLELPRLRWARIQVGNCGSPVLLPEGWLLPIHGVGALREYSLGAVLLSADDPSVLLGATEEPLIAPPADDSRNGYVPNVVYSCGGALVDDSYILPYATSDQSVSVAIFTAADLLARLS